MHGIELRRRSGSGSGLLRADNATVDVQDRGARGFFGLSGDGGDVGARRERNGPPRRRRRVAVASAAVALLFVAAVVAVDRRRQRQPRPRPRTFSYPERNDNPLPPPSALCSPADASTRLEFFSDIGGFSFPTATSVGEGGDEDEDESAASSRKAQRLIDQGWLLYRGFHRSAAVAAFSAALELSGNESSGAALGLSWSLGPGANLVSVDSPAPYPAFEADRDFPLAAEAARRALELAERAAEEWEGKESEGRDDDENGRRRLLARRDLALARIAARRFAPGTAGGRARRRAEAEAAAAVEDVARRGGGGDSSAFPLPDPALLSLAAELRVHESQWDYWRLPSDPSGAGKGCANADCLSFALGRGNSSSTTGWPSAPVELVLKPHAAKAAELVREALTMDPREPLALHLAVHLSEAAPPAQAAALGLAAADALAGFGSGGGRRRRGSDVPGEAVAAAEAAEREGRALLPARATSEEETPWALGQVAHLLHMPVHLYTRVGAYSDAVSAGIAASHADDALASRCIESYAVEHNAAALVYAANLAGRREVSKDQIERRLSRSSRVLGPAMSYAEGTTEVTLGISTEVLFADWSGIAERRKKKELERLEADARGESEPRRWRIWAKESDETLLPASSKERGLCVSGGAEFARAMLSAASALELAARADREAKEVNFPSSSSRSLFGAADAAVASAERLASSLPPEPRTRPGGGPGIYACGHREVAEGVAALARARLLLARGASGGKESDGGSASAAAAAAAAKLLEPHERLQFDAAYMEPPRSQVPLAPCLGYARLRAEDFDGAAEAFRRDLASRPGNGRGLLGLALALEGTDAAGAREARRAFEDAWRDADAPLSSPCPALSE